MGSVITDRRFGVNSGKAIKVACVCATTANVTLSGEQTIDGIACVTGDRVLVHRQTDGTENGVYTVDTGAWSRAKDFDDVYDVAEGSQVPVSRGSTHANRTFKLSNTGTITPGTTSLTFLVATAPDNSTTADGWLLLDSTPNFVTLTNDLLTFTVSGDYSTTLSVGRGLNLPGGYGTLYTHVLTAVHAAGTTTVTCYTTSGLTPDNTISAVYYGITTTGTPIYFSNVGYPILSAEIISGACVVTNPSYIWLDAYRYGAVGDGVTDDYNALNNAMLVASGLGGGTVLLDAKTYLKSAALTLKEKCFIKGKGMYSTVIKNNAANINGINMESVAGTAKGGGISQLVLEGNASDTTNEGISFNATNGYGMAKIDQVRTKYFNKAFAGGDELWELRVTQFRMDQPISYGFYIVGSAATGSDNVFEKCYVNNVGNGAATGRSFQIQTACNKSIFINTTFGDTSSTDTQWRIEGCRGVLIHGGNCEGFALATTKAAIETTSDSVVTIDGMVFQSIDGPGTGQAYLISATGTSIINVRGCYQYSGYTGTLYSMSLANTAIINHHGNSFNSSSYASAVPSGARLAYNGGKLLLHTPKIDLSGAAVTHFFNVPNRYGSLITAKLIYTEASSADAGILIEVGHPSDTNFLAELTSEVSKAINTVSSMTLNDSRIGAYNQPIVVTSPGGKTGTGEVIVVLEITLSQ